MRTDYITLIKSSLLSCDRKGLGFILGLKEIGRNTLDVKRKSNQCKWEVIYGTLTLSPYISIKKIVHLYVSL